MSLAWWSRTIKRQARKNHSRSQATPNRRRYQPHVESLEERSLLADGVLDPTFGTGGIVSTMLPYTSKNSLAVQSDGKVVVAGVRSTTDMAQDFSVARFNADGSLDTSFGSGGFATVQLASGSIDQAQDLVLQTDGKIVVAGTTTAGGSNHNFGVARLKSDGSLDTSYGKSGIVLIDFYGGDDQFSSMTIQADDKVVVAGLSGGNFALARINTDGTQDSNFDADGKILFNFGVTAGVGTSVDGINDITVQPDGQIVAVGFSNLSPSFMGLDPVNNFAIARINQIDGTLDSSFGHKGLQVVDFLCSPNMTLGCIGPADVAQSVSILPDNRIAVAGETIWGANGLDEGQNFGLVLLDKSGGLDHSFNADGEVITDLATDFTSGSLGLPPSQDIANSIAIQADGKIVLAGQSTFNDSTNNRTLNEFTLTRYNTDGTLDETFGTHGKVFTAVTPGGDDIASNIALTSDGRIVVAGLSNNKFALARYSGLQLSVFSLSATAYSAKENHGSVTITVNLSGTNSAPVSVHFATSDATAIAGKDYTATAGTLTFNPGETTKTFTVPFIDDGVYQFTNKTFNVTLSAPVGLAVLGQPKSAVVTIVETFGSTNQSFIDQVYKDLLGRPADQTGLDFWTNKLTNGETRQQVVREIENGQEYRVVEVKTLYTTYLHRAADRAGINAFTALLAQGQTVEAVAAMIVGSSEYFQHRGGGTNDGFLDALYADALGRSVDSSGRQFFDALLAGNTTRQQVAAILFSSTEYRQDLVKGYYLKFLHRAADSAGLNFYVGLLSQPTPTGPQPIFVSDPLGGSAPHLPRDEDVIAMIIGSGEYLSKLP